MLGDKPVRASNATTPRRFRCLDAEALRMKNVQGADIREAMHQPIALPPFALRAAKP